MLPASRQLFPFLTNAGHQVFERLGEGVDTVLQQLPCDGIRIYTQTGQTIEVGASPIKAFLQGKGCAPSIVGVGLGGDRGSSFACSKEQFLRRLDDTNPDPVLADLEARLFGELNELGIGPSGFGGRTTVLGVKIGKRHRVPACYFVSVSYVCWAYRKAFMSIEGGEVSYDWD